MKNIFHFVDGKEFKGESKRLADVFNPATGEVQAKVNLASKSDVDAAIKIASKAFPEWADTPPITRARILFKFKELIEKNSDELTKLIVAEHGKVYDDAKGSLTRGLEVVEFACGIQIHKFPLAFYSIPLYSEVINCQALYLLPPLYQNF